MIRFIVKFILTVGCQRFLRYRLLGSPSGADLHCWKWCLALLSECKNIDARYSLPCYWYTQPIVAHVFRAWEKHSTGFWQNILCTRSPNRNISGMFSHIKAFMNDSWTNSSVQIHSVVIKFEGCCRCCERVLSWCSQTADIVRLCCSFSLLSKKMSGKWILWSDFSVRL